MLLVLIGETQRALKSIIVIYPYPPLDNLHLLVADRPQYLVGFHFGSLLFIEGLSEMPIQITRGILIMLRESSLQIHHHPHQSCDITYPSYDLRETRFFIILP